MNVNNKSDLERVLAHILNHLSSKWEIHFKRIEKLKKKFKKEMEIDARQRFVQTHSFLFLLDLFEYVGIFLLLCIR